MRTWNCDSHCGPAGIDERGRSASGGFTAVRTAACARCDADRATAPQLQPAATRPAGTRVAGCAARSGARTAVRCSAAAPAPTTMDQVVNLFIEREHGLIKVLVEPHAGGRDLSAESDRRPATRPRAQRGSLFPRPHGYGRNRRPQRLSEGTKRHEHADRVCWAASRSSTRCSISPWASPGWSMPTAPTSTASTMTSTTSAANSWATCAAWCLTSRPSRSPATAASWAASGWKIRASTSCA